MKFPIRLATLALAAGLGLTAAPSRGADATLGHDQPPVPLAGAEHWTLRPARVALAAMASTRSDRTIPLSDLPTERRTVRIVYRGYPEGTPLSVSR